MQPHIDVFLVCQRGRRALGPYIEAHHDRIRRNRQQDVGFLDRADAAMDHAHLDLLAGQLGQGLAQDGRRALEVGLENNRKLAGAAVGELLLELLQRQACRLCHGLLAGLVLAELDDLAGFLGVGQHGQLIARLRQVVQAQNDDRRGRSGRADLPAAIVHHCANLAQHRADYKRVPDSQRAVLCEHSGHRTLAAVELRLQHHSDGGPGRVGTQFAQFGNQIDHFEQVVDALSCLGRDRAEDGIAAPLFRHQSAIGKLLLDTLGLGLGQVHLVDRDNDRDAGLLGVVDGFDGLGHDAVVSGNDQHHHVGHRGAVCPHFGERFMAGCVDEHDPLAVLDDVIGADRLGDATSLAASDIGRADLVEQRGLAVVDMPHDRHDRRPRLDILHALVLIDVQHRLFFERQFGSGRAEMRGDRLDAFQLERLVDGRELALLYQEFDDEAGLDPELFRQFFHRGAVGREDVGIACPRDLGLALALLDLALGQGL